MAKLFLSNGLFAPLDFVSDRLPQAVMQALQKKLPGLKGIDFSYLEALVRAKAPAVQVVRRDKKEMRIEVDIRSISLNNGTQIATVSLLFPLSGEVKKFKPVLNQMRKTLGIHGENPPSQLGLIVELLIKEPIAVINRRVNDGGQIKSICGLADEFQIKQRGED